MDYWELRKRVSRIIPRATILASYKKRVEYVKEKGRKKNYSQFNLIHKEWKRQERLLNTEAINSFLEISTRAAACPMPFNMDVWDGLLCPFGCIYCYANSFRASLYTAFFDNSKTLGMRHCSPDYYKKELDKMESLRSKSFLEKKELSGIRKAFALEIPIRLGIRFEDFLKNERRAKISLEMLNYLADIEYPVMINTKSDLVGEREYVKALSRNNAGAAVHITSITSDENLIKKLEPGAPSYKRRLEAMKALSSSGVRVVARIEPYLFLINDRKDDVYRYIEDVKKAGVRNITFDTYSYTAGNKGIRQSFLNKGFDFDRLFLAGCDSQPLGSLLLGKFMDLFRREGLSCSTFDMGNVPANDQDICCEVSDWFKRGFNYGCTVIAARYIKSKEGKAVSWKTFDKYVNSKGGWLNENLKLQVKKMWNLDDGVAYSNKWAVGIFPAGIDEDGIIWKCTSSNLKDYREKLLEELL